MLPFSLTLVLKSELWMRSDSLPQSLMQGSPPCMPSYSLSRRGDDKGWKEDVETGVGFLC